MTTPNITPKAGTLDNWHKEVDRSRFAHYDAARYYTTRNFLLGIPAVLLSAVVGSAVFSSLAKEVDPGIRILVGILSLVAGALAALQTFLGYSARAEKHRIVGAKYGSIRREIEVTQDRLKENTDIQDQLDAIRKRMDSLGEEAPTVPPRIWKKACKQFDLET